MIKTFKKAIAIMLTLVFVLSLVPVSGLAEEGENKQTVNLTIGNMDYGYTRIGSGYYDDTYFKTVSYLRCRSIYPGHIKLNLSGYEEILKNEGTTLTITFKPRNGYSLNCFNIVLANDNCDTCDYSKLSYNMAKSLNFYDNNRPVLYVRSDAAATTAFTTDDLNLNNLINVMDENPENSNVALWLKHVSDDTYFAGSSTFNISYDASKIDNQAYVNSAAEKLTWDIISSENADMVTQKLNLPKKLYGADVTWTSTKEDVISSSSGEVIIKSDAAIPVTLTANLTYNNFRKESASVEKPLTFDVVVRDPSNLVTDERIALTNYAYSRPSANNNPDARNHKYGYDSAEGIDVIKTGSSFTAYGQFDLSGYEEILSNQSTSVLTKFVAGSADSGKIYDLKAVLTADSTDVYINSDVTYNSAEKLGLHNDDRPILFIKSDGTVYNRSREVKFETNKDALIQVLNEGTENSVVSLHFVGITHGETSAIRTNPQNSGLFISYDKTEIDNQAYLTDVKNALTWNVLSKGAQDKVSADLYLPTKFKGANIVWETDGVVIKSSGEVDFENNKSKTVTLKAKMSYTNILGDNVKDEKTFTVTISDGTCDIGTPTVEKGADKFTANWAVENYTGSDITYYVYLAAYSNNELVGLTPVTYVAKNGIPTSIAPTVECKEGYTAKLIIIEDDKLTPLFKAIER